jgi:hypothetical protein
MRAGAAACAAVVLLGAVAWLPPKAAQRGLLLARHPRRERLFSVKNPEACRARPRLLRLDPVQESGTVAIIVTKS